MDIVSLAWAALMVVVTFFPFTRSVYGFIWFFLFLLELDD